MRRISTLTLLAALACAGMAAPAAAEDLYDACTFGRMTDSEQVAVCTRAIAAEKSDPKRQAILYFQRGHLYAELGQYAKTVDDYTASLRLDDNVGTYFMNTNILQLRADAWAALGNHARAIEDYNEILRRDPKHTFAIRDRGISRFFLGQYGPAVDDLRQSLKGYLGPYPEHAVWLYLATVRLSGAETARRELAANFEPNHNEYWPTAAILFFLGRLSIADLRRAAEGSIGWDKDARLCDADYYVGQWHLMQGRREQARALLQRVVQTCRDQDSLAHWGAVAALKP